MELIVVLVGANEREWVHMAEGIYAPFRMEGHTHSSQKNRLGAAKQKLCQKPKDDAHLQVTEWNYTCNLLSHRVAKHFYDEELWEVVVLLQIIKWDPEVFRLKKPAWRTVVSRL